MSAWAIVGLALIPFVGWFVLGLCAASARGESNY
jgi:hypothetical protein